jgi:predicted PurR-regulated permease PerM
VAETAGPALGDSALPPSRAASPFTVGFGAAVGVGLAFLLYRVLVDARDILILVIVSLFFAVGLDPAVRRLQRVGLRRPLAVLIVFLALAGLATAFGFAVVPPLVDQVTNFVHHVPGYLTDLQNNRRIASLDRRFHLLAKAHSYVSSGGLTSTLAGNALTAGTALATTVFDGLTILILTLYFMAYLDSITEFAYRLVPRSKRNRAQQVGSEIRQQVGEYVAGNVLTGLIAGVVSLVFFTAINAPFPIALAFVVALLDVVPLVGAAIAAIVAATVVAISSIPHGIATIVFLSLYQVLENYVLIPRLFRTRVVINPAGTIIGALAGATLFGVIGFLLAIPLVATVDLVVRDVFIPRQRAR